ncbi:MAG: hypothetical protein M5U25_18515 [Planctomycetota bacterium]|nr:hypothetical protein [Planctomycetota bacterium]
MQHPEEHDITALAYGLVEGAERESLLTHLAGCDACRAIYDAYRDEQANVREAIVRDARSGAAEARALENTLRMLGAIEAEAPAEKRGRLLRLPRWVLMAEVAAVLAVAVGLFFIIKPGEARDEVLPVAEADRAPATVDQGVVYARNTEGEWKPAEALPMDEWVMAGDAKQLSFTLADGSKVQLEQGAVFRIALENGESGAPVVIMLHGKGELDSAVVRAGETGFYALPGARLRLECESGEVASRNLRAWSSPHRLNAQVLDGDVVLKASQRGFGYVPLKNGEKVEWDADKFQVIEADGGELQIGAKVWYSEDGAPDEVALLNEEAMRRHFERMRPRIEDFEKRMREHNGERMRDVRQEMQQLELFLRGMQIEIERTVVHDVVLLVVGGSTLQVTTDGETISATVQEKRSSVTYKAATAEDLRELLPARFREQFDGIQFERDEQGRLRLAGSQADATGSGDKQVKVKIIRETRSDD